jgi:hypothetical protein
VALFEQTGVPKEQLAMKYTRSDCVQLSTAKVPVGNKFHTQNIALYVSEKANYPNSCHVHYV